MIDLGIDWEAQKKKENEDFKKMLWDDIRGIFKKQRIGTNI